MVKPFRAADLFCGAGGTSTGLIQACAAADVPVELTAVNHWDRAVETHAANHPKAFHFCQDLADLDPKKAVPGGKLDLLVASPECTHHSVARGGKPVNDQSRASAYCVHRWAAALQVKRILIENVPEFTTWGPLGSNGRPLASGKGKLFQAYVETFRAMGYRVEWRVLNAADFGAATTRKRLFIQAAKGRLPIRWPDPTHQADPTPGLFGNLPRWRAAREVIDWSIPGQSIFNRKRPLSENTLKRIEAGLRKFGGAAAEPFLVILRRNMDARSLDQPAPAVLARAEHIALCEPFLMGMSQTGSNGDRLRPTDVPLNTITTADDMGIVRPFVMHTTHQGSERVFSPDDPLPCVTGANRGEQALVQPFVMRACNSGDHNCRNKSVEEPIGTIHAGGGSYGLVEPFIIPANYGEREGQAPRCHDIGRPVPTVVAGGVAHGVVEPFILPHRQFDGMQVDDVGRPMRTLTATNGGNNAVVQPFLVPYYRTGVPDSVDEPVSTITTRDRLGLVEPQAARLDIRFRMLQPHELAAAMGFPAGYRITGNRGEQVKQIGNAVEVNQARELCSAALADR